MDDSGDSDELDVSVALSVSSASFDPGGASTGEMTRNNSRIFTGLRPGSRSDVVRSSSRTDMVRSASKSELRPPSRMWGDKPDKAEKPTNVSNITMSQDNAELEPWFDAAGKISVIAAYKDKEAMMGGCVLPMSLEARKPEWHKVGMFFNDDMPSMVLPALRKPQPQPPADAPAKAPHPPHTPHAPAPPTAPKPPAQQWDALSVRSMSRSASTAKGLARSGTRARLGDASATSIASTISAAPPSARSGRSRASRYRKSSEEEEGSRAADQDAGDHEPEYVHDPRAMSGVLCPLRDPTLRAIAGAIRLIHREKKTIGEGYLWENLYPQTDDGMPVWNKMGRYVLKVYVNGRASVLMFDDRIPVLANNNKVPLALRSVNPREAWPLIYTRGVLSLLSRTGLSTSLGGLPPPIPIIVHWLTGWIPMEYPKPPPGGSAAKALWELLAEHQKRKVLVTVSRGEEAAVTAVVCDVDQKKKLIRIDSIDSSVCEERPGKEGVRTWRWQTMEEFLTCAEVITTYRDPRRFDTGYVLPCSAVSVGPPYAGLPVSVPGKLTKDKSTSVMNTSRRGGKIKAEKGPQTYLIVLEVTGVQAEERAAEGDTSEDDGERAPEYMPPADLPPPPVTARGEPRETSPPPTRHRRHHRRQRSEKEIEMPVVTLDPSGAPDSARAAPPEPEKPPPSSNGSKRRGRAPEKPTEPDDKSSIPPPNELLIVVEGTGALWSHQATVVLERFDWKYQQEGAPLLSFTTRGSVVEGRSHLLPPGSHLLRLRYQGEESAAVDLLTGRGVRAEIIPLREALQRVLSLHVVDVEASYPAQGPPQEREQQSGGRNQNNSPYAVWFRYQLRIDQVVRFSAALRVSDPLAAQSVRLSVLDHATGHILSSPLLATPTREYKPHAGQDSFYTLQAECCLKPGEKIPKGIANLTMTSDKPLTLRPDPLRTQTEQGTYTPTKGRERILFRLAARATGAADLHVSMHLSTSDARVHIGLRILEIMGDESKDEEERAEVPNGVNCAVLSFLRMPGKDAEGKLRRYIIEGTMVPSTYPPPVVPSLMLSNPNLNVSTLSVSGPLSPLTTSLSARTSSAHNLAGRNTSVLAAPVSPARKRRGSVSVKPPTLAAPSSSKPRGKRGRRGSFVANSPQSTLRWTLTVITNTPIDLSPDTSIADRLAAAKDRWERLQPRPHSAPANAKKPKEKREWRAEWDTGKSPKVEPLPPSEPLQTVFLEDRRCLENVELYASYRPTRGSMSAREMDRERLNRQKKEQRRALADFCDRLARMREEDGAERIEYQHHQIEMEQARERAQAEADKAASIAAAERKKKRKQKLRMQQRNLESRAQSRMHI